MCILEGRGTTNPDILECLLIQLITSILHLDLSLTELNKCSSNQEVSFFLSLVIFFKAH